MEQIRHHPHYGSLIIVQLMNPEDLGISLPEPHPDRALGMFLERGSDDGYRAIAPRIIKMRKGVLFLQSIEGDPKSGMIYLYTCATGTFYILDFEVGGESLTVRDFEELVEAYALRDLAACPERIPNYPRLIGKA